MAKDEEQDVARDQDGKPIVGYVGNQREHLVERVEAEGLDPDALDPADPYVNLGHIGAGTIMPDGTYGAPLPDPMVAKLAAEAQELDTHGQDADQPLDIKPAKAPTKAAKATEPTK